MANSLVNLRPVSGAASRKSPRAVTGNEAKPARWGLPAWAGSGSQPPHLILNPGSGRRAGCCAAMAPRMHAWWSSSKCPVASF